jgi:hypothetical protein
VYNAKEVNESKQTRSRNKKFERRKGALFDAKCHKVVFDI